jgi:hypothetical protein
MSLIFVSGGRTQPDRRNILAASVAVRRLKETGFPDDPILVAWRGMRTLLGNDRAIVVTSQFECCRVFQKKVHTSCRP